MTRRQDRYFALLREFEMYRQRADTTSKVLIGLDIGGRTPALATVENLRRVVERAQAVFSWPKGVKISIETTPVIADRKAEKIAAIRALGIERISIGVQTTT